MTHYNFYRYFTLYFILYGIILSLVIAFISYAFSLKQIQENLDQKAQEIYEIKRDTILKPALENMDHLVRALGENSTIEQFLDTKDAHTKNELQNIFLSLAASQKQIMQIRLLGVNGKELIRVDRVKEKRELQLIDESDLQDKSNRDYFITLAQAKESQVWHSKIDLNIEHGVIEVPYKPTLRIGLPLFDAQKHFCGAVLVNLYVKDLLDALTRSSTFEHYIFDQENNYIVHPDDRYSFNKYKQIKRDILEDFSDGMQSEGVYRYSIAELLHNEDNAFFVFKTKETYQQQLIDEKLTTTLIVLFISVIISTFIAYFVSQKPIHLQTALVKAYGKLEEFTSIIDKYIITATTKKNSTILSVSSAFEKVSGYERDEVIGKKMRVVRHPDEDANLFASLWETILSGKTWVGTIKNRKKNGEVYYLEQHIVPNIKEDGEIESFVSIGIDVTAQKEIERLSRIDILTGAYNRGAIDMYLTQKIKIAERYDEALSLIMLDIDFFKSVNDTYGHQRGDAVLQDMAKIVKSSIRDSDIFGRFGGEEFMIVCPKTKEAEAFMLAEKLRKKIEGYSFEEVGKKTISLGIAQYIQGDTLQTLVEKADSALYRVKNSGRNQSIIFS